MNPNRPSSNWNMFGDNTPEDEEDSTSKPQQKADFFSGFLRDRGLLTEQMAQNEEKEDDDDEEEDGLFGVKSKKKKKPKGKKVAGTAAATSATGAAAVGVENASTEAVASGAETPQELVSVSTDQQELQQIQQQLEQSESNQIVPAEVNLQSEEQPTAPDQQIEPDYTEQKLDSNDVEVTSVEATEIAQPGETSGEELAATSAPEANVQELAEQTDPEVPPSELLVSPDEIVSYDATGVGAAGGSAEGGVSSSVAVAETVADGAVEKSAGALTAIGALVGGVAAGILLTREKKAKNLVDRLKKEEKARKSADERLRQATSLKGEKLNKKIDDQTREIKELKKRPTTADLLESSRKRIADTPQSQTRLEQAVAKPVSDAEPKKQPINKMATEKTAFAPPLRPLVERTDQSAVTTERPMVERPTTYREDRTQYEKQKIPRAELPEVSAEPDKNGYESLAPAESMASVLAAKMETLRKNQRKYDERSGQGAQSSHGYSETSSSAQISQSVAAPVSSPAVVQNGQSKVTAKQSYVAPITTGIVVALTLIGVGIIAYLLT